MKYGAFTFPSLFIMLLFCLPVLAQNCKVGCSAYDTCINVIAPQKGESYIESNPLNVKFLIGSSSLDIALIYLTCDSGRTQTLLNRVTGLAIVSCTTEAAFPLPLLSALSFSQDSACCYITVLPYAGFAPQGRSDAYFTIKKHSNHAISKEVSDPIDLSKLAHARYFNIRGRKVGNVFNGKFHTRNNLILLPSLGGYLLIGLDQRP